MQAHRLRHGHGKHGQSDSGAPDCRLRLGRAVGIDVIDQEPQELRLYEAQDIASRLEHAADQIGKAEGSEEGDPEGGLLLLLLLLLVELQSPRVLKPIAGVLRPIMASQVPQILFGQVLLVPVSHHRRHPGKGQPREYVGVLDRALVLLAQGKIWGPGLGHQPLPEELDRRQTIADAEGDKVGQRGPMCSLRDEGAELDGVGNEIEQPEEKDDGVGSARTIMLKVLDARNDEERCERNEGGPDAEVIRSHVIVRRNLEAGLDDGDNKQSPQ